MYYSKRSVEKFWNACFVTFVDGHIKGNENKDCCCRSENICTWYQINPEYHWCVCSMRLRLFSLKKRTSVSICSVTAEYSHSHWEYDGSKPPVHQSYEATRMNRIIFYWSSCYRIRTFVNGQRNTDAILVIRSKTEAYNNLVKRSEFGWREIQRIFTYWGFP